MDEYLALLTQALGGNPPPRGAVARMARETGVRENVIWRWLSVNPPRPSATNLRRVADYLGVSFQDLIIMVYGSDDGSSDGHTPRPHPPSPTDRLIRVSDVLAAASEELRRAAQDIERGRRRERTAITGSANALVGPVSQPRHGSELDHSNPDRNHTYDAQEAARGVVLPFPVSIPPLGDSDESLAA